MKCKTLIVLFFLCCTQSHGVAVIANIQINNTSSKCSAMAELAASPRFHFLEVKLNNQGDSLVTAPQAGEIELGAAQVIEIPPGCFLYVKISRDSETAMTQEDEFRLYPTNGFNAYQSVRLNRELNWEGAMRPLSCNITDFNPCAHCPHVQNEKWIWRTVYAAGFTAIVASAYYFFKGGGAPTRGGSQ